MLTPEQLADAHAQLDRLLGLIAEEVVRADPLERSYLSGSRDALALALRPDEAQGATP